MCSCCMPVVFFKYHVAQTPHTKNLIKLRKNNATSFHIVRRSSFVVVAITFSIFSRCMWCVVFVLKWLLISCALFLFVCNSITDCYPRSGRIICCCVSTNLMFAVPICSFGSDRLSHPPSPVLKRKRITILVSMCQNYKLNFCVSVVKPRPPTSSHGNSLPDLVLLAREEECRAYDKGPSARHFNECFKLLHSFRIISGRAFFKNKLTLFFYI